MDDETGGGAVSAGQGRDDPEGVPLERGRRHAAEARPGEARRAAGGRDPVPQEAP